MGAGATSQARSQNGLQRPETNTSTEGTRLTNFESSFSVTTLDCDRSTTPLYGFGSVSPNASEHTPAVGGTTRVRTPISKFTSQDGYRAANDVKDGEGNDNVEYVRQMSPINIKSTNGKKALDITPVDSESNPHYLVRDQWTNEKKQNTNKGQWRHITDHAKLGSEQPLQHSSSTTSIFSEADTPDPDVWNLDDVPSVEGRYNIVGPNSVIDKPMLNTTLRFKPPHRQQQIIPHCNYVLNKRDRNLVRNYVACGAWQGNNFCIGMKVDVVRQSKSQFLIRDKSDLTVPSRNLNSFSNSSDYDMSSDGCSDDKNVLSQCSSTNCNLAVIIAAYHNTYDVEYCGSDNQVHADASQLHESCGTNTRTVERNVSEHRMSQSEKFQASNDSLRISAIKIAAQVFESTKYTLCDVEKISKMRK